MPMTFIYVYSFFFFFLYFCYYLGTHKSKDTLSTQGSNQLYPPNPFLNADVHIFYTTESAPPVMPKNMNLVEKEAEKEAMNINNSYRSCALAASEQMYVERNAFRNAPVLEWRGTIVCMGGPIKGIFKKYIKINHNTKFSKFGEA